VLIIPAIDLHNGSCVRLFQGDFNRQTIFADPPRDIALKFESLGLKSLHIVDLDGARVGVQGNGATVREIADCTEMAIQLGGGIRDPASFRQWLAYGVSRCVIGSLAVGDPGVVSDWFREFGADRIVLALDVRLDEHDLPLLATHGWTRTADSTLWECLDAFTRVGLKHVLCTDISRDGALSGPNLDLYRQILQRYPSIELQASGGVRDAADLHALRAISVHAAITGRALLENRIGPEEIALFLPGA
jgi:phosphoribosylformimino-5-aminoimidazole carboxamide ribotide isomerase